MRGSALCTVVPLLCALTRGVGVYTHGAGSARDARTRGADGRHAHRVEQGGAGTALELCTPSRSAYVKTEEPRWLSRAFAGQQAPAPL
jgi:hypothetical protein